MNYYERHIGDYAKDTAHLSMLEHGAYTLLLDRYYGTEAPIPADQAHRVARARSKDEREAVDSVLREFFVLVDGAYHQGRCDEEIARCIDKRTKAKRSANARWADKHNECETHADGMRTHSERITDRNANGMLSNLQSPISNTDTCQTARQAEHSNGKHSAVPGDVERVFDHWRLEWGHQAAKLDPKRTKAIRVALKSYTAEQLCTAISGYRKSPFHTGTNDRSTVYDALTLLLKDNDHIDAGLKFATAQEKSTWM